MLRLLKKNTFEACKKDTLIYLLIRESEYLKLSNIEENKKVKIDAEYSSEMYKLTEEIKGNVISYNKKYAEDNYKKIINRELIELKEKKRMIKCKQCYKKYNFRKSKDCPYCGAANDFTFIDIIHQKGWYS